MKKFSLNPYEDLNKKERAVLTIVCVVLGFGVFSLLKYLGF